ncbi:MAG: ABC transporter ATP-binding protein [Bacteroidota bacterium]
MKKNILLETTGISKSFKDVLAVIDLNLEVHEGEIFGFLGTNGAGKSTSINMICGLLRPDKGTITFKGSKIDPKDKTFSKRVGLCPQNILLWPKLTCFEQLVFSAQMYDVPYRAAKEFSLRLLTDMGLEEKKNKLAFTLSGGMQRRLNVIMALVHDPEIVVLDEPEAGLDPQSRVLVRDYIRSLAGQKTVILTTHNMDEAERICDRIAIIDHGKLLVTDTPDNLKRNVGKGDMLEMDILSDDIQQLRDMKNELSSIVSETDIIEHTLVFRRRNIIDVLSLLLETIKSKGLRVGDVRLRENSLEDVFITLTGRRLRE